MSAGDLAALVSEDLAWIEAHGGGGAAAATEGGVQPPKKKSHRGRRWKPYTSMTWEEKQQLLEFEERKVRRAEAVVKQAPRDARGRLKVGNGEHLGNAPRTLTTDVIDKQRQLETEVMRLAAAGGLVVVRPAPYHAGEGVMGGLGTDAAFLLDPPPAPAEPLHQPPGPVAAADSRGASEIGHADARAHGNAAGAAAAAVARSSSRFSAAGGLDDYSFIHKEALDLGEEDLESMDRPSLVAVVQALQRQLRAALGQDGGGAGQLPARVLEEEGSGGDEEGDGGEGTTSSESGAVEPPAKRPRLG